MSRTRSVIRNMQWGMFQKGISLLFPFITRTIIIKILGGEYLGLNSLFTSVLTILNLAELGVSNAIVSNMYKPIVEHDTDTICALMAFYRKAYRFIGSVILLLGLFFLPFLRYFIKGDVPADINIYILYLIYLFNTASTYYLFAYKNCLFVAHQRNDIISKVQTFYTCVQHIIQIILILLFRNYYVFVIIIPLITILNNITVAFKVDKEYPTYKYRGDLDSKTLEEIKKKIAGLMLARISATIRSALDSLFISAFIGLQCITIYDNYIYIVTAVAGIIQLLESSLIAGIGDSLVRNGVEKNYKNYNMFTFMLQWIVGWAAICILCLIQPFIRLWLGNDYLLNEWMPVLCAVYLFVNYISMIRSAYTQALGMWWSLRYVSLIDIAANALLNFALINWLGVYGIILATILDIVIVSIPWTSYFLFKDFFGKKYYFYFIKDIIKYLFIFFVNGIITFMICKELGGNSDICILLVRGATCVIIPNLIYFIFYFRSKYAKEAFLFIKEHILCWRRERT